MGNSQESGVEVKIGAIIILLNGGVSMDFCFSFICSKMEKS